MNTWLNPGIHHGVPFDVYRADDLTNQDTHVTSHGKSVSKSLIVDFIKDAAAWKAKPRKVATKAMRAGSLFDCLLTTPDKFDELYVISKYDEFRTNESKAWRAEMEESGVEVIKQAQLKTAQEQIAVLLSKPEARDLIYGADFQVAFRHKTKHPFFSKGLIDVLPAGDGPNHGCLVDIKTCEPGALESHHKLRKHIYEWGYHIQAGCYCDGYSHASGDERSQFKFIFVSSAAPYTVAVVPLPLAAILLGAEIYRSGVNKLAECLETNLWPSMWDGEVELDLPEYAYTESNQ
jgi:hypothetical protein